MLYFLESETKDNPAKKLRGLGPFCPCLFSLIQNSFEGKKPEMRELREGETGGNILFFP